MGLRWARLTPLGKENEALIDVLLNNFIFFYCLTVDFSMLKNDHTTEEKSYQALI